MSEQRLNINDLFQASICSFEVSKRIAAAGISRLDEWANYGPDGQLGDFPGIGTITGSKEYPAVPLHAAIMIVSEEPNCRMDIVELYNMEKKYVLWLGDISRHDKNLVDLLLNWWLEKR